jgi:hypothetical protein
LFGFSVWGQRRPQVASGAFGELGMGQISRFFQEFIFGPAMEVGILLKTKPFVHFCAWFFRASVTGLAASGMRVVK